MRPKSGCAYQHTAALDIDMIIAPAPVKRSALWDFCRFRSDWMVARDMVNITEDTRYCLTQRRPGIMSEALGDGGREGGSEGEGKRGEGASE